MNPAHNTIIIYVPGLFDHVKWVDALQRRALKGWEKHGATTEVFLAGWKDDSDFDPRLDALCERIEQLAEQGLEVSLVGASAGATAVVGALHRLPQHVKAAVIICGKVHRPHIIPEFVLDELEVFDDALDDTQVALAELTEDERSKLVSMRSMFDAIVPPKDSIVRGAQNIRMPIIGHLAGIGFGLVRYGRFIAKFCTAPRNP